jgi:hypothetical protein
MREWGIFHDDNYLHDLPIDAQTDSKESSDEIEESKTP